MKPRFRQKILIYSSALLVALIAAMLLVVNYEGNRFAHAGIEREIEDGRQRVREAEQQRVESLWLTASAVASFPTMRSFITDTDGATIRDYLQNYQEANKKSDLLFVVLDSHGRMLARTDKPDPAGIPEIALLLQSPPEESASVILHVDSGADHVAIVPVEAAGETFGYVVAAAQIDPAFVRRLQELTGDSIVIATDRGVISNLPEPDLPWHTQEGWNGAIRADAMPGSLQVAGERFEAVAAALGGSFGVRPLAVVMKSQDQAMQPYRRIQIVLLAVGLVAALTGIALSALLAGNVTAPVAKLLEGTREVAAGNFDYRLNVQTGDEIGELADSFNLMTQGLRERADMQKFVSQSTVEMIQSSATQKISAGERVTLTVLFSDMRGFTSMTESLRPEETVRLLNSCLSLQADRVKTFHGDVDKFVGDCVVALFSGEDMELNAIRCSVEIHRALDALNASHPDQPPLRVGIGVVRGEVILGSIGSEDRLDYTVIGSNVNLCSRLCSMAGPRETLLSESTYARVEGLVAAERGEPLHVKGFSDPVPVYRMRMPKGESTIQGRG